MSKTITHTTIPPIQIHSITVPRHSYNMCWYIHYKYCCLKNQQRRKETFTAQYTKGDRARETVGGTLRGFGREKRLKSTIRLQNVCCLRTVFRRKTRVFVQRSQIKCEGNVKFRLIKPIALSKLLYYNLKCGLNGNQLDKFRTINWKKWCTPFLFCLRQNNGVCQRRSEHPLQIVRKGRYYEF